MKIIRTVRALRQYCAARPGSVGFVPTMGYFHDGHLSLMRRAKGENAFCVVSLFVNPLQFGPAEDLARYPRDLARDVRLARKAGADALFVPADSEMYPRGKPQVFVDVTGISAGLCGASRPGHFRGVATIVAKLLNIVRPRSMYLGQKDAQQVAVLQRLVADLDLPVKVVVCPTFREPDGLAMSSRNRYLSPSERSQAPVLFKALRTARTLAAHGESDAAKIIIKIKKLILDASSASIEYVSCVDAVSLQPVRRIKADVLIALAVRFPTVRLIDNTIIKFSDDKKNGR